MDRDASFGALLLINDVAVSSIINFRHFVDNETILLSEKSFNGYLMIVLS